MPLPSSDTSALERSDLDACKRLLANGSRTFHAASFLLPRRVREPAVALYAFCRVADDAVDNPNADPHALEDLRSRLDAVYRGEPRAQAVDRAFARIVQRFVIPQALPSALIEGFEWDRERRRYETFEDLTAYATRVAGTVGAMMALLMGVRRSDLLARATDLGIAMQLTNIARDVGEDAAAGRIYLPLSWMRSEGLDPERWLHKPVFATGLARVIARLLRSADEFYRRSEAGIDSLPLDCRGGIYAARHLYAEIGREVERRGYDSVSGRAIVAPSRKLALLARTISAVPASITARARDPLPATEAARHLVEACAGLCAAQIRGEATDVPSWWDLEGRVARVLGTFERLAREERASRDLALQSRRSAAQSRESVLASAQAC